MQNIFKVIDTPKFDVNKNDVGVQNERGVNI